MKIEVTARLNKSLLNLAVLMLIGTFVLGGCQMFNKEMDSAKSPASYGGTFTNPIVDQDSPDPSIVYKDGYYYFTYTHNGADIVVEKSRTLNFKQAARATVWYPEMGTMYSNHVWAPEIQFIRGKWYIYFAASDADMNTHRSYVLEADTDDPLGTWTFKGKLTDETDKWAIDGIALEHKDNLYFIWSGWEGDVNIAQNLYIAPMSDPLTISGPRVEISRPEYDWEKTGGPPFINEGPAILKKNGKIFVVYSAAGSWTPHYALGMLTLEENEDPLVAANWQKSEFPLFTMNDEEEVYGPGHNTFTVSPDGTENWIVFHANESIYDGWNNRKARAQRIEWTEEGTPVFGQPRGNGIPHEAPSGQGRFLAAHAVSDKDGSFLYEDISVAADGIYPLVIRYTTSSGSDSEYEVEVNGENHFPVKFVATDKDEIRSTHVDLELKEGRNSLLISPKSDRVDVVSIEIPRYEAEHAYKNHSGIADNITASGGQTADPMNAHNAYLEFRNILVANKHHYILRIGYDNRTDKMVELGLEVNGKEQGYLKFEPTKRNEWKVLRQKVNLQTNGNVVRLVSDQGNGVVIDYIEVLPE
jgi:GH43 family beta-xylosidase